MEIFVHKKSPEPEPRGYMSGNEPVESGGDVSALFYPYQAAFSGVESSKRKLRSFGGGERLAAAKKYFSA